MEDMEAEQQQLVVELRPEFPEAEEDCTAQPSRSTNPAETLSSPGMNKRNEDAEMNNRETLKHGVDRQNRDRTTNAEGNENSTCGDDTLPGLSSVATEGENLLVSAMNTINNNDNTTAGGLDNHAVSGCNTRTVPEQDNHVSNVTVAFSFPTSEEREQNTGQVDFNENRSTIGDQQRDCNESPSRNSTPDSSGGPSDSSEHQLLSSPSSEVGHSPHATEHNQGHNKAEVMDVDVLKEAKPPAQSQPENEVNEMCCSTIHHNDTADLETDLAEAKGQQSILSIGAQKDTEGVAYHQNSMGDEVASTAVGKHCDQMEATGGGSGSSPQRHTPDKEPELAQYLRSDSEENRASYEERDNKSVAEKDAGGISVTSPQLNIEQQLHSKEPSNQDGEHITEGNQCERANADHQCDKTTPDSHEDADSTDAATQEPRNTALDLVAMNHGHTYNGTGDIDSKTTSSCGSDAPVPEGSCPPQEWDNFRAGSSVQGCWKDSDSSDITGDEEDDEEEEEMDPRVSENLEIMNQSCADVNRLENELDEARNKYRANFQESSQRMEELSRKIKKNIQRARSYFELIGQAKEAQNEALRAARQYQTANGNYRAAKEMITLAEQTFLDRESINSRHLNSAWQETLNHATERVMESEREKTRSEAEHNKRAAIYAQLESRLQFLEKKFKRSIAKARPYFETKAELELKLQQLKQHVWDIQQTIGTRKARYAEALRCLEMVSMEIHESRRKRNKMMLRYPREPGVGAESDSLTSSISDVNIERNIFSTTSYPDEDDDDMSDDGGDVFSPGSRGHSRENSHGTPPVLSRASSLRHDAKKHRRSASGGSAASGSVFSSPPSSVPQSPATESVSSQTGIQSVSSPDGFYCVPGFAAALKLTEGGVGESRGPSSDNPTPGSSGEQMPTTLLNLAEGDYREFASNVHSSSSSGAKRPAGAQSEDKDAQSQSAVRNSADSGPGETAAQDDERVAGDGSSCEEYPQGEQQGEGSRSSSALPFHNSPKDSGNSNNLGLRTPSPESRSRAGSEPPKPQLTKSSSLPKGLDDSQEMSISPLAVTPQSSLAASQPKQADPAGLAKAGSSSVEVKKQPLRRAKPLQGFFVLNPSDLASSISSPSLRF